MIYREKDISVVAKKLIENARSKSKNLCFYAPMGAGKTTLIKSIVSELGGVEEVNSPTFGIVNEYQTLEGKLLGYHFDFYRLEDEMEALDLGFEDYLKQDVWIFIEWPEKITSFLPEDTFNIEIEIVDLSRRKIRY